MSILITERAKSEINRIVEEQKNDNNNDKKQYLRVRVVGGGCSGFQYKLTMDEEINEKLDELYEINEGMEQKYGKNIWGYKRPKIDKEIFWILNEIKNAHEKFMGADLNLVILY